MRAMHIETPQDNSLLKKKGTTMNANITIRTATTSDIDPVADFYTRLDHPGQAPWIKIMMDGRHPYTSAENFVLAKDRTNGKIVSCAIYMPWTYLYDGVPIGVSRMEQVFTDPEYQGQGLMKAIFHKLLQLSDSRGDLMQVVYGRPGLYRHLGFSFALPNEEAGLLVSFHETNLPEEPLEFAICPAEETDLPRIVELYHRASLRYAVYLHMGLAEFLYAKNVYPNETLDVIKNQAGEVVGFIRFWKNDVVYALELVPTVSYYRFRKTFLQHFKSQGVHQVAIKMGEHHPFYDVLDEYPQKKLLTLHGYGRIGDIPAFLRAVAPVLGNRMRASAYAGFDGTLVLCLYHLNESYRINFMNGRLAGVVPVAQDHGDVCIVRDHLIKFFLGQLSLDDLDRENAEITFNHPDFRRIFGILFPKKQSFIYSIN
jgi:predicted N-acetyltransferase YhbS